MNISTAQIETQHMDLLEKGLSFVPTPRILSVRTIIENKDRLIRSLKLKSYFHDSKKMYDPKLRTFSDKSNSVPSNYLLSKDVIKTLNEINKVTDLSMLQFNVTENEQGKFVNLKDNSNLTFSERKALNELKDMNNIVIKPADKGGRNSDNGH